MADGAVALEGEVMNCADRPRLAKTEKLVNPHLTGDHQLGTPGERPGGGP